MLREAQQALAENFAKEDSLAQAAQHLIICAADVVALLPGGDLESAREALGCARAAVATATYAVQKISDRARTSS